MTNSEPSDNHSLLVTEFDGTMSKQDFYLLAARSWTAEVLSEQGLAFHRFERWSEIALLLCDLL